MENQDEVKMDEIKKAQDLIEEKTVIICREKLLPILKEANLKVEDTKMVLQVLDNTITQGIYNLANKENVSSLGIDKNINKDYPNVDVYVNLIEALNDETMSFTVNALRWLNTKIDKDIKDTYIDKTVSEIVKAF